MTITAVDIGFTSTEFGIYIPSNSHSGQHSLVYTPINTLTGDFAVFFWGKWRAR
jgi:hypothetical protein